MKKTPRSVPRSDSDFTLPCHGRSIDPDRLYLLEGFKPKVGLADSALRAARRAGLTVRYIHRRGYVLGSDWIEYVLKNATTKAPGVSEGTDPRTLT